MVVKLNITFKDEISACKFCIHSFNLQVEERKKRYWQKAAAYLRTHGFDRDPEKIGRKWVKLRGEASDYKTKRNATGNVHLICSKCLTS